ncbi:MAG: class I SAM-dependent methyltransferase [Candidatus Helarchaeota archaeon]
MDLNWDFIDLLKSSRGRYIRDKSFQKIIQELVDLKGGEKILDVGCGIGTLPKLINIISEGQCQIYGIDTSPTLINWAQKNWGNSKNIHLSVGNVYNLDFPDNIFDIVISFGLLEWLTKPYKALDEMVRVNKSTGKFLTLTIALKEFEKSPETDADSYFYEQLLKGMKKYGVPVGNEAEYIQKIFQSHAINSKIIKFVYENEYEITKQIINSYKTPQVINEYKELVIKSRDYYFQFLKAVGWSKAEFLKFMEEELTLNKEIELLENHIGEIKLERHTIPIIVSL